MKEIGQNKRLEVWGVSCGFKLRYSGSALLRSWRLCRFPRGKGIIDEDFWGESLSGRGSSQRKGPEAAVFLVCSEWLEASEQGGKQLDLTSQVALVVKNPPASAYRWKRHRFDPCVGKIPWRRQGQPTPELLPGESHGQRNLAGYSPYSRKESDTTELIARIHMGAGVAWWLRSGTAPAMGQHGDAGWNCPGAGAAWWRGVELPRWRGAMVMQGGTAPVMGQRGGAGWNCPLDLVLHCQDSGFYSEFWAKEWQRPI